MKPSTLAFETRAIAEHAGEIDAEALRVLPNIEGSTK